MNPLLFWIDQVFGSTQVCKPGQDSALVPISKDRSLALSENDYGQILVDLVDDLDGNAQCVGISLDKNSPDLLAFQRWLWDDVCPLLNEDKPKCIRNPFLLATNTKFHRASEPIHISNGLSNLVWKESAICYGRTMEHGARELAMRFAMENYDKGYSGIFSYQSKYCNTWLKGKIPSLPRKIFLNQASPKYRHWGDLENDLFDFMLSYPLKGYKNLLIIDVPIFNLNGEMMKLLSRRLVVPILWVIEGRNISKDMALHFNSIFITNNDGYTVTIAKHLDWPETRIFPIFSKGINH